MQRFPEMDRGQEGQLLQARARMDMGVPIEDCQGCRCTRSPSRLRAEGEMPMVPHPGEQDGRGVRWGEQSRYWSQGTVGGLSVSTEMKPADVGKQAQGDWCEAWEQGGGVRLATRLVWWSGVEYSPCCPH